MAEPEYSPGEVARTLGRLEQSIERLTIKIDTLGFVPLDVWHVERDAMNDRIQKLENGQTWVIRLVLGMVLAAVIGAVLVGTGSSPA